MPILPTESDCYPPDLWSAPAALDPVGRWWCLHTKPRQEKSTARELGHHRLTHYLPQVVHESRTPSGRKTRAVIPLFPGYVFLHGDAQARLAALRSNRLVKVLWVDDQRELTRDLGQIHQVLKSGLPVLPEPTYPVGTWVRVLQGPLAGLIGLVTRRDKGDRFTALVRFLGQGIGVALQDWQVEPLNRADHPKPSSDPADGSREASPEP